MAEYEKMTVANLRVLLKDRGIPSTGLTRKAQIVAKLQEEDAAAASVTPVEEELGIKPAQEPETVQHEVPAPDVVEEQTATVQETPATPELSMATEQEYQEETRPFPEMPATSEPLELVETVKDNSSVAEPQSPTRPVTKSARPTRSTSQTPLPSKEEPIPQPPTEQSVETPPVLTRENTVQTDPDERKKRKRRSGSPPVNTQDVAIKRARIAEEVHLEEDKVSISPESVQNDVHMPDAPQPIEKEDTYKNDGVEVRDMAPPQPKKASPERKPTTKDAALEPSTSTKPEIRPTKDIRYQQLRPVERTPTEPSQPISIDDLPTPPASIHAATRALYVRNFMRPLQLSSLRNHLASLTGSSDDDVIETLYVDSIRTHAFVVLKTLAAAARIRAGLHDQVWPTERDRKPLWADYVPDELVQKWIDVEENAGGGTRVGGNKWEVTFEPGNDGMVAHHVEIGGSAGQIRPPPRPEQTGPSQPARQVSISKAPVAPKQPQPEEVTKSFVALDKLFESTKAKPMLYFMPVKADVADKRLNAIDHATSKNWSSKDWRDEDELRRFTFEDEKLVDTGIHNPRGRGGLDTGRGGASSRYGRGPPRGAPRGNWRR